MKIKHKKRIIKALTYLAWGFGGVILGTSIIVGGVYLYNYLSDKKQHNRNYLAVPEDYENFSKTNSFHISLKFSNWMSNGTAWSWYLNELPNNKTEWYLMTNFHVVNYPIASAVNIDYVINDDGTIKYDEHSLLEYYKNNHITKLNIYENDILGLKNGFQQNILQNNTNGIESISIITDFNNDRITLFSLSDTFNNHVYYNLDMALIKIVIDKNQFNSNWYRYIKSLSTIYNLYEQDKHDFNDFYNQKNTYIAGFPSGRFSTAFLPKQNWTRRHESNLVNDLVLQEIKAPYYFSENYYKKFPLTGGASGSSVYQVESIMDDLSKLLPIGIYWGGIENSEYGFFPSFIPFYNLDIYNIYVNFSYVKTDFMIK